MACGCRFYLSKIQREDESWLLRWKPDTATPLMGEVTQILGDTGQESPASCCFLEIPSTHGKANAPRELDSRKHVLKGLRLVATEAHLIKQFLLGSKRHTTEPLLSNGAHENRDALIY